MAWKLIYGGVVLARYETLESVETKQSEISDALEAGVDWFSLQFARGDGIGTHKVLLSHHIPIVFLEAD